MSTDASENQTTYAVAGMTCGHCEQAVAQAVSALAGVRSAVADRSSGSLTVKGEVDEVALVATVREAGYELVD